MTVTIALSNQKGGVGKTTGAVNTASALVEMGKRVLLVDCDPQGSLSAYFGVKKKTLKSGTFTLIKGEETKLLHQGNLSVCPTNIELAGVSIGNIPTVLRTRLKPYLEQFDFILIDTPPNLDLLTINALVASQYVIIPTQCQFLAIEGLAQFRSTLDDVRELSGGLEILAVLPNIYSGRRSHEQEALEELRRVFGEKCQEPIPDLAEYPAAAMDGRPVGNGQVSYWRGLASYIVEATR